MRQWLEPSAPGGSAGSKTGAFARRAALCFVAMLAAAGCARDRAGLPESSGASSLTGLAIDQGLGRAEERLDVGDTTRALALASEALRRAEAAGDTHRVALAHRTLAAVAHDREDSIGELDHALAALHGFERLGEVREVAETERRLVSFYLQLDLDRARGYAESALAAFRRLDDRRGVAEATGNLGQIRFEEGNAGAALELFREAAARCREIGVVGCEAANLSRMSYAFWKLGRPAEMLGVLERALALVEPEDNPRRLADLRTDIGLAKLELGRIDESRRDLEEALRRAESIGATRQQIVTLGYLSRAYEQSGDPARALAAERRRSALFTERFSAQLNLQIASAQSRGELARQATENERIRELERRRLWTLGVVSLLSLVLVGSLGVIAWIRHRAARKIESKSLVIELKSAELTEALTQLRVKEAEARQLFENSGEGIASVDFDERFRAANPAADRIFGVPSGSLVGRRLDDFLDDEGRRLISEQTARRRDGESDTYELEIVRPDQTRVAVLVTATPQRDARGAVVGTLGVFRDITERKSAQDGLRSANESLGAAVEGLRRRDERLTRVNQLNELLLGCTSREEAYQIVGRSAPEIVDGEPGFLAMAAAAPEEHLEIAVSWGGTDEAPAGFSRDDCWAIRRGQIHESGPDLTAPPCAHVRGDTSGICIPLVVRGTLLGLLHVRRTGSAGRPLQVAFAESIKLGLSNLALRESLEEQAVRDPLTGLFNRRFLDVSLPRELERARRQGRIAACAVLDIDDFKRFNDEFGHEAGDLILREMGRVLRTKLRSTDLACRLGGDEIVVLLPDSTVGNARDRLAEIRREIARTRLIHLGRALDPVSISVGIAEAPPGSTMENVLRDADHALMRAKQGGKDRIVGEPEQDSGSG